MLLQKEVSKGEERQTRWRSKERGREGGRRRVSLGRQMTFTQKQGRKLYFSICGVTQKPEDFKRQIQSRFGVDSAFRRTWSQAKEMISEYNDETLKSGRRFFDEVYKPRRDALAAEWNDLVVKK